MEEKKIYYNLKDIPDSKWQKLSEKVFFFGHQSVGYNILDGVRDIMREHPNIKLKIIEGKDAASIQPGSLLHSPIGQNMRPESKINDFLNIIQSGVGTRADAVFLKFCYVDIDKDTDPEALFSSYVNSIENIRKAYPKLKIIHFTSPLTTLQTGPKAWIKKIIGRPVYGAIENMNRHKYNELLRNRFEGKDPILDIALIESTRPDGTRFSYTYEGNTYYAMDPEYTYDGGHLNELCRKKVAEHLILILANL